MRKTDLNIRYGQLVDFGQEYRRVTSNALPVTFPAGAPSVKNVKSWEIKRAPERRGIFLGTRTLQNGVREWTEEYIVFHRREHIIAALVSFSATENPVYVPLEALKFVEL